MKRVVLFAAMFVLAIAAPAVAAGPSPGAPGLGDRLFPRLGNGGYDVQHYDLDLRYATASPTRSSGTVTILAGDAGRSAASTSTSPARASAGSCVNGAPAKFGAATATSS